MTADIVNLRMARKRKARAEREAVAAANRARHGESKAQKDIRRANETLERRRLEQARRASGPDDERR